MQIRVQHEREDRNNALDRIVGSDGMEHFFTKNGYYDGWGRAVPSMRREEADHLIKIVELGRNIERT